MYNISLLPEKYRQERIQEKLKNDILISFAFSLIILGLLALLAVSVYAIRHYELNSVNDHNANILSEINELKDYELMKNEVDGAYNRVSALASGMPSFPNVVIGITETIPESIEVTDMDIKYSVETSQTNCTVSANALFYEDVSNWIDILDKLEITGEIFCSYTTDTASADSNKVNFELKISITETAALDDIVWDWEA